MSDEARFRARPESGEPAEPKFDPTPQILADLQTLIGDAQQISKLGRDAFLGPEGSLARHAADGILIKVQELCDRLPEEFRAARPEVQWMAIRGIRNRLGHNYRATDHKIVWETVTVGLPLLLEQIERPPTS